MLRKRSGKFIIFLILFAFIAGSSVCAQKPKYGGTLIFGSFCDPLNLDPGVISDSQSAQVASNIFETLVRYDAQQNRFLPLLATSWEVSPDNKIWTFHLRKNVVFHDNTPFNANAVKFSWERQMDPNHAFHNPQYGRFIFYRAVWGGYPGNIKSIRVINEHTVQVELYSRSHRFLSIISSLPFAIVSPAALKEQKANFTNAPVGTGPFKLVEWRRWQRIVLSANKQYWEGRPYLDWLIFEPTPGRQSRHRQISREFIQIMENPDPQLYNFVNTGVRDHLRIQAVPGNNFSYISLNCQKPPLDIPMVRKALQFTINRKRILAKLNENYQPASAPLERLWGENLEDRTYAYNINTAKALLKKAGYPNGFPIELWFLKPSLPYCSDQEIQAIEIARGFREAGLDVTLKGLRWENYLEKLRYGDHQAAITGIVGIDHDPEMYFHIAWSPNNAVLGGTNLSFYRNENIRDILTATNFTRNKKELVEGYGKIQSLISDDSPIIPLFHNRTILVINKKVNGVEPCNNGIIDFSKVWLQK